MRRKEVEGLCMGCFGLVPCYHLFRFPLDFHTTYHGRSFPGLAYLSVMYLIWAR